MAENRQRLDKWLWFVRLTKSRTLAQKLIVAGKVRINREKTVNAADPVKPGDVLTISLESGIRVLKVVAPGLRRGPAAEARLLYEDLTPTEPSGHVSPRVGPRPTKRDRRTRDGFTRTEDDSSDDAWET